MIQHVRRLSDVKMILFVVNGQEPRFDSGTKILIKTFEQSFGDKIWNHFGVLYTRWESSDSAKKRRKMQKLTEDRRRDDVLKFIANEYPASKGKPIDVYFTDTFEVNNDQNDATSETLKLIWNVAAAKEDFKTSNIQAVKCVTW